MHPSFRYGMMTAILIGWITYYPYVVLNGYFESSAFLPFHLCNIMELLIFFSLWTRNEKILDIIVYPLILGPIAALSHPLGTFELGGVFATYFVYYHVLLMLTGMYFLYRTNFKTSSKRILNGALFVFTCDGIAFIVNTLTDGNYMFIGDTAGYPPIAYYSFLFLLVWILLAVFHLVIHFISTKTTMTIKESI